MKSRILKLLNFSLMISLFVVTVSGCSSAKKSSAQTTAKTELIYYNEANLKLVKAKIKAQDPYFLKNYKEVIKAGNKALNYVTDPVTNKTQLPASGDKHDYMTYAPYAWPDTTKADGMPWKARDGIINPVSRGNDTDNNRKTAFFAAIDNLVWSYYFSDDRKYADKAVELIRIWYLNPETRVNPNMNFGQAFPGVAVGRNAGVHEWKPQQSVITALQLFDNDGILPADVKSGMDDWLKKYLTWLTTNEMAVSTNFTGQNHANYYNCQVIGLMMYFGENVRAKAVVEDAKLSRIADQITPEGIQPKEMGRTKSVSYTAGNLWLLTELTMLGRKLGIDLWDYESADGRSLKKAYAYLVPYVLNPQAWPKKQITEGGADKAIEEYMLPLFSKASTVFGVALIDPKIRAYQKLSPMEALIYPPIEMLPELR